MIKLLALDIDDTLIRGSQDVRAENLEAVAEARRQGVKVTIVTGRRWANSADRYARLVETEWPVGTVYGARMIDARTGQVFHHVPLEKDVTLEIVDFADRRGFAVSVLLGETVYLNRPRDDGGPAAWSDVAIDPDLVRRLERNTEGATNLMVWGPAAVKAVTETFAAPLQGSVEFMFHGPGGVPNSAATLLNTAADKGKALLEICNVLGVDPSEVVAMGDSLADVPMIRAAGIGVAMGWAEEGVRQAADVVADPEDPHPVATMVRRLVLNGQAGRVGGGAGGAGRREGKR